MAVSSIVAGPERQAIKAIFAERSPPADGTLIVHSGIRRLIRAGYSIETLIDSLLDALPGGNLLMPVMTWRTVTSENPVFDELETPSHTGVLTETFRLRNATARSLHPTHSVAGAGPLAADLLATHHTPGDDGYLTPCSRHSPYGLLYDAAPRGSVYILLMGVGLESCTAFHHPEEIVDPEFFLRPRAEAETYTLRRRDGWSVQVENRRHKRLPRDFPKFGPPLEADGRLSRGEIEGMSWQLFSLHDLLDRVFAALRRRSEAVLESEPIGG